MCPNKKNINNTVRCDVNVNGDCDTACFFMGSDVVVKLLSLLSSLPHEGEIVLSKENILTYDTIESYFSIEKVVIRVYLNSNDVRMVVNVDKNTKSLYMYTSEDGIDDFKESLLSLKINIDRGEVEDISMMVEEWGGDELLNKKIDKDSEVVCHLRLYGII